MYLQKADRGVSNIDFLQNQCYIPNLFVEIGVYLHELSALRMCSETSRKINALFKKCSALRAAGIGCYLHKEMLRRRGDQSIGRRRNEMATCARDGRTPVHDKMMEE